MLILVKTPFTEFVPGEGMVVGNMGRIVSLPDKMADSRIDAGFGEESTQEAFDEQEAADAAVAEEAEANAIEDAIAKGEIVGLSDEVKAILDAPKPRGKGGRKPRAAKSPVDAPVA